MSRPLLQLGRVVWSLLTTFVLFTVVIGTSSTVRQIHVICKEPNCEGSELTAQQVHLLHQLGLSQDTYGIYAAALLVIFALTYAFVAAAILSRQSQDRMTLFTAFTLVIFGGVTFSRGSHGVVTTLPLFSLPMNVLALIGSYSMVLFFYSFPDGRFAVRRPAFLLIPWAVLQAAQYFAPGSALGPKHMPGPLSALAWLAALGSMVYVQVRRYRAVSNSLQRQQTKWVVFGVTVALSGFLVMFTIFSVGSANPVPGLLAGTGVVLFMSLIPLSIGFAILRYRLWDMDVIIKRTLVYAVLTASLAVLYIGGVIALQALFRALTGQGSGIAVAVATLGIAALFQPFRSKIQTFIDRRFYRGRYDAAKSLSAFTARLSDEVDLDQIRGDIVTVVRETMQPAHVSLWIRESKGGVA